MFGLCLDIQCHDQLVNHFSVVFVVSRLMGICLHITVIKHRTWRKLWVPTRG